MQSSSSFSAFDSPAPISTNPLGVYVDLGAVSLAGGEIPLMKFEALAILRAGVHCGEYYEATNDEGDLIGYTMWMPPGQMIFSTSVLLLFGLSVPYRGSRSIIFVLQRGSKETWI